jgi:hypothetical protein
LDIVVVKWRKYIAVYVLFILLPTLEEEWENCGCIDWRSSLKLTEREEELERAMTLRGHS